MLIKFVNESNVDLNDMESLYVIMRVFWGIFINEADEIKLQKCKCKNVNFDEIIVNVNQIMEKLNKHLLN